MNETVNLWKLFLLGFQILELRLVVMKLPVSDKQNIVKQSDNRYYSQQVVTYFLLRHSKNINLPETRHLIFLSIVLIINISLRQLDTLTGKSMTKFILEIRNQDWFSDISGLYIGSI
jgi:hypothetical protein